MPAFLCKTAHFKAMWLKSKREQSKNIFNNAMRVLNSELHIFTYTYAFLDVCMYNIT